jgi:hypothetical protein
LTNKQNQSLVISGASSVINGQMLSKNKKVGSYWVSSSVFQQRHQAGFRPPLNGQEVGLKLFCRLFYLC